MRLIFLLILILTVKISISQDTTIWTKNSVPVFDHIIFTDKNVVTDKNEFSKNIIGTWVFESYTNGCEQSAERKESCIDTLVFTSDNFFRQNNCNRIDTGKYKLVIKYNKKTNKANKTLITDCGNLEGIKTYTVVDIDLNFYYKNVSHSVVSSPNLRPFKS